jgi:ABC-type multidrug transport system ATPase subunit
MSKGRLIVEGSSVELKKKYGEGYVVKGYDKDTKEEVVMRCKDGELEDMLRKITEIGLENWGLRETTLEEVFMNVNQRF